MHNVNRVRLGAIARRHGLRAVIMFGSRARGDAGPGSDMDICISAPRLRGDELALLGELCEALRADVDLCVLERIGPSLKAVVVQEGKLLYGSRDYFDRLRIRALCEWQDARAYTDALRGSLDRYLG